MTESSDKPFSFTDKRKYRDPDTAAPAEGTQGTEEVQAGPAAQSRAPGGATPEQPAQDGASGSEAVPEEPAGQAGDTDEVDDLTAEAGALYDEAVREADALKNRVAELEEQLKRDQAEYVNSRRRIEQSAASSRQDAAIKVLTSLLGVLDEIELARQHGDLEEGTPFASIAAKLEDATAQHGLERYGAAGEEFDPALHEALMHNDSKDATSTTLEVIMQPGYKIGDRVIRPARVGTVGPN